MIEVGARVILAGVLVVAAAFKLASPGSTRAALATFGIRPPRAQALVWGVLVITELGLAAGVAAGLDAAAFGAAALMLAFAAGMALVMRAGNAGAPCACFGARSTVSGAAIVRNLALSAAFVAVPFLPEGSLSTDEWLGLGLALALLLCLGLGIAVLALAREVGMLRLRLGPEAALEIPEEGPALGSRVGVIERFEALDSSMLGLAVFTSDGCHVCRALQPAVESLARDPHVAVVTFEEGAEAAVWEALGIPGSPFAVTLDAGGTVLAKGTFNNLAQLESVLATAERRRAERSLVEAAGVG